MSYGDPAFESVGVEKGGTIRGWLKFIFSLPSLVIVPTFIPTSFVSLFLFGNAVVAFSSLNLVQRAATINGSTIFSVLSFTTIFGGTPWGIE